MLLCYNSLQSVLEVELDLEVDFSEAYKKKLGGGGVGWRLCGEEFNILKAMDKY